MEEKWERLFKVLNEEDFTLQDFLFCVCCNLRNKKEDEFKASMTIDNKFFEIEIKKRGIQ